MTEPSALAVLVPEPRKVVSRREAEQIIEAVLKNSRKRLCSPNPEELAVSIRLLQEEFEARKIVDSILPLSKLKPLYNRLEMASKATQVALQSISGSWSAYYFMVHAQGTGDLEKSVHFVENAKKFVSELIERTAVALSAVEAARGPENAKMWSQLAEITAIEWLWTDGLPLLFEESFRSPYSLPGDEAKTSPGLRFAQAMITVAGVHAFSPSTLRQYAKRRSPRQGEVKG